MSFIDADERFDADSSESSRKVEMTGGTYLNIAAIAISAASGIISGLVLYFVKKYFDKKEKRDSETEMIRHQTSLLTLKSINALGKLTVANSIALRDGKTNGEMKAALEEYSKVNEELASIRTFPFVTFTFESFNDFPPETLNNVSPPVTDFPEPDSPTIPRVCFSIRSNEISSTALTKPFLELRLLVFME